MNQIGRSMLEIVSILAIIGILSIASIQFYNKLITQHKISKTMHFISMFNFIVNDSCRYGNCPFSKDYDKNRHTICSFMNDDKELCKDGSSYAPLFGLKREKQQTTWLIGQYASIIALQIANLSPQLCNSIVSAHIPFYQIRLENKNGRKIFQSLKENSYYFTKKQIQEI